ncbi:hypothetical protein PG608_12240 [Riemerella anatipestifer]|uniref:hypothetical protein n=1 Tax=Riemerella anatipestifer TaxID=34085 RepID=UPI000A479D32|nr:hypothetical protein [Riemerella anatipestifer]MDY3391973.1 hypothetical protein [Riemerella anatipestifer]MDY3519966.1 hypothetical protein [Riemerella anatipestifer]MDY3544915.1 hypothetical protein [Riemerella anatipestifer]MEE3726167.1 hypothetical protein [Riemerella anatipestifer]
MVRNIIILISVFSVVLSCSQTRRLQNGTKVLTKKYKNIDKFDKSIFEKIDTDYFYQKVDYYMANKNFQKVRDIGKDVDRKIQFYDNGRVRFFSLGMESPNPEDSGMRGIIYKKNNRLKIDYQSADQDGSMFISTYTIKVDNDLIYLLENSLCILNNTDF